MIPHPYPIVRLVEVFAKVMAELPIAFFDKPLEDKAMALQATRKGGKKGGKKGC